MNSLSCLFLSLILSMESPAWADDNSVKSMSKKSVVLFPAYGVLAEDGQSIAVNIHAWVFEKEHGAVRSFAIEKIAKQLGVKKESSEEKIFTRRMFRMAVDNKRGKVVQLAFTINRNGKRFVVSDRTPQTQANGHAEKTIDIPLGDAKGVVSEKSNSENILLTLRYGLEEFSNDEYQEIRIPVIPAYGLTVVSDIDDTIKLTNIPDKKEMLKNSFLRKFKYVKGMKGLFKRLEKKNTVYHYVSSGPWQFQEELQQTMKKEGLPQGVFHMQILRLKSIASPLKFLTNGKQHKLAAIKKLLKLFPKRDFILVGDSGEKDPEIYGEIVRTFPHRIGRVLIRVLAGADNSSARFQKDFAGVPASVWQVFSHPSKVK